MNIFNIYLTVAALSALFGILLCLIFRGGLKSFIGTLFSESQVQKFWARIVYTVIILSSVSGALSNTYPESAKEDKLVLVWAVVDQLEAMLFRLLWVFLILFSVFLIGWAIGAKKK
ncbi:MAG: hypothetical protein JW984_03895 [Deltaproteobacteria bacterium]|uniref:Uncharacterized protein n=1 Tax=Candidatus Zymogenus saltonus TaxID=2844893 RepID=A0A9D8KBB7_9DELT|nr:hypothetical protein [Candidatus Zymogenus saltonus]